MKTAFHAAAAMKGIAAILLVTCVAGCNTTKAVEVPPAAPREEQINSLALEQCIRENGPENCSVAPN